MGRPEHDTRHNEPAPANLLTVWSRLLVESLRASGVRQAVVSPGSRSTPLLAALLETDRVELFSMLDERVAAFFALGLAKASGSPPLLLCTSGSAGAHYYPAVLEAEAARLPLVIVTADRPPELHGCGAPQTVDQQHLYGSHVRHFVDLGVAEPAAEAVEGMLVASRAAVRASLAPVPGPVQVNMPVRKPLEPLVATDPGFGAAERRFEQTAAQVWSRLEANAPVLDDAWDEPQLSELVASLKACRRGLVVAGPRPFSGCQQAGELRRLVSDLAARLDFALAPEATSGLRFGQDAALGCFTSMLRCDGVADLLPEVVLQIGRPPVATAWYDWVERMIDAGGRLLVVSADAECDPTRRADAIVVGDPAAVCRQLLEQLEPATGQGAAYLQRVREIDHRLMRLQEQRLEACGDPLSEAGVVRQIVHHLPVGALLAVGNSLPIRLLEEWGGARSPTLHVDCQRGLNGIDGLVAGFAGLVSGLERSRSGDAALPAAVLVLGDVSALHDVGGFAALAEIETTPCAVVVLNNDGGRIFEQLPVRSSALWQAESASGRGQDFWLTSHARTFQPIADLHDVEYRRPQTVDSLMEELGRVWRSDRGARSEAVHLIEVPLPPSGHLELTRAFARDLTSCGLARDKR
jgi:2-succinyl-5-enolpyruvyl-6-hydroxy-3-cyclohexene-1-carboxylate synthase